MRELLELRAIAKGKVQGVGFRARVKKIAEGLNLKGYARNLPDGSVEVCAQGVRDDLEKLLAELEKAFSSLPMEIASVEFQPPVIHYPDFSIY